MRQKFNRATEIAADAIVGDSGLYTAGERLAPLFVAAAIELLRRALLFLLLVVIHLTPEVATAQVSKEFQLKAVVFWRLAQFTQWSSDAFERPDSPIVICVLGENPFGDALEAAVRGETAHGRTFVVRHHRFVDQVKSCHILFIAGAGPRLARDIRAALAGRSVLTVSDIDGLPSS
jgi:hypothetical protein